MKLLKLAVLCLLIAALCAAVLGCERSNNQLSDIPNQNLDQPILPGFQNPTPKPLATPSCWPPFLWRNGTVRKATVLPVKFPTAVV